MELNTTTVIKNCKTRNDLLKRDEKKTFPGSL